MKCTRGNANWRCSRRALPGLKICGYHQKSAAARHAKARRKLEADPIALERARAKAATRARVARVASPEIAERGRAACREWAKANPVYQRERARAIKLRLAYGITVADFDRMLAEQGGACAICRTTDPRGKGRFHVDHDHDTGRVRGLLCHHCNVMLGNAGDSAERLRMGADYLDRRAK